MTRKTDAELLEELNKIKKEIKSSEKDLEEDEKKYTATSVDNDDETESKDKLSTQIIEREINLSLINDKLNFIISKVQRLN